MFQYVEVVQVQLGETSQGQTVDCDTSRGRGFLVFLRRFDSFHLPAFARSFIQGVQDLRGLGSQHDERDGLSIV